MLRKVIRIFGVLIILVGLILTVLLPVRLYNRYKEQDSWLKVEGTLVNVREIIDTNSRHSVNHYFMGVYEAQVNDNKVQFQDMNRRYVRENEVSATSTLYINPNNYNDYHIEYAYGEWLWQIIIGLVVTFVGIMIHGLFGTIPNDSKE